MGPPRHIGMSTKGDGQFLGYLFIQSEMSVSVRRLILDYNMNRSRIAFRCNTFLKLTLLGY